MAPKSEIEEIISMEEGIKPSKTNTIGLHHCCSSNNVVTMVQKVPLFIIAQLLGSVLASGTSALMFDVTPKAYFGTVPVGSNSQSLVAEIIITFLLMFVISAVSTDDRALGEFTGIAVGITIMLNIFVPG
ncbi:unnamed protein product [Lupinus luteus]|uniref:Uncharacterized protein n=1 Tax=Lupinus luteus TaxID=3873 RepID=A0AAV1WE66_LUPLU